MSLDIDRIRALCFDIDGTLRDTDDQYVATFARFISPLRYIFPKLEPKLVARRLVMTVETPANVLYSLPDRFGIDDEIVALVEYLHRRGLGRRNHRYLLINGIIEMLSLLSQHYPMAVISARPRIGTIGFLEHFELTPFFNFIASAQTAPRTKPWPDPIIWAADQMNVLPETCLMIGDTTVDIEAGKAAGTQTVGVLCGFGTKDELEKAGADLILDSTADLENILKG